VSFWENQTLNTIFYFCVAKMQHSVNLVLPERSSTFLRIKSTAIVWLVLPRSGRRIVANREHDPMRDKWGHAMTAGEYVAAAVLIVLILCGVKGILTQDKFRL